MTNEINPRPSGKLIVIEGIDGAGTTTQARMLADALAAGHQVHLTAQPSDLPVGKLIRQVLQKEAMVVDGTPPDAATMSLLFAADRQFQQAVEIGPRLASGQVVICDRYVYSSVIYQSLGSDRPDAADWIKVINRHIMPADLVFWLNIDAQTAANRRTIRNEKPEIFDEDSFQARLARAYGDHHRLFPGHPIVPIDGTMEPGRIHEQLLEQTRLLLIKEQ